uniref:Uncharacterized protein n=1 Tax=uncultured bacterium contig00033 TaxID=1181522 RepID=A0A806KQE7_9BACT|nr:hypothetical protein [uncultured bacterium contig00033]
MTAMPPRGELPRAPRVGIGEFLRKAPFFRNIYTFSVE